MTDSEVWTSTEVAEYLKFDLQTIGRMAQPGDY